MYSIRIWPIKIAGAKYRGSNPNEFDDIFFNFLVMEIKEQANL